MVAQTLEHGLDGFKQILFREPTDLPSEVGSNKIEPPKKPSHRLPFCKAVSICLDHPSWVTHKNR